MAPRADTHEREGWVAVGRPEDLGDGGRKLVTLGPLQIAVFRVEGRFFAVDNRCPHRGGPLIRGHIEGFAIRCPMHGWRFDLRTGESERPAGVKTYAIKAEGHLLYLRVDP